MLETVWLKEKVVKMDENAAYALAAGTGQPGS
jgi:hypothetical protein